MEPKKAGLPPWWEDSLFLTQRQLERSGEVFGERQGLAQSKKARALQERGHRGQGAPEGERLLDAPPAPPPPGPGPSPFTTPWPPFR